MGHQSTSGVRLVPWFLDSLEISDSLGAISLLLIHFDILVHSICFFACVFVYFA